MEVLFEDALCQFYEAFPECTADDRMPVLRDDNQVIFKVVSSYCTKVIGEEKIFRDTVRIYREALSFLVNVVNAEWVLGLSKAFGKSAKKAQRSVELLTHGTVGNVPKYKEFDKRFYKYPSYLRRAAISEALGAVSSYRSNLKRWTGSVEKLRSCRYPVMPCPLSIGITCTRANQLTTPHGSSSFGRTTGSGSLYI